nr:hypothetical protein GCM10017547_39860 [Pseudarthrobacter oxydans]
MVDEPADIPDALVNGVELQVARQLLVPPAIEHLIKGLLFGMKQLDGTQKVHASGSIDCHSAPQTCSKI